MQQIRASSQSEIDREREREKKGEGYIVDIEKEIFMQYSKKTGITQFQGDGLHLTFMLLLYWIRMESISIIRSFILGRQLGYITQLDNIDSISTHVHTNCQNNLLFVVQLFQGIHSELN